MHDLVSIVIPCYNHEKYIDSCIQSIMNQSYDNIELLICDDCSPDSSYEKLLAWKPELEKRFPRVEIYRNEKNQGVCKNLNELINRAQGDFIKTLASDDMLRPNAISDYVDFARTTEFDVAFSNAYVIGENDSYPVDEQVEHKKAYNQIPPHGRQLTHELLSNNFIQGASFFIRKETFEKYGLFDEQYIYEDWEFHLRVSTTGIIEYMDKVPVYYRVADGSLSHYNTSSEVGRKKFRIAYQHNRKIFEKYSKYATKVSENSFFNQNIRTAVVLNDHDLVNEMLRDMKALNVDLFWGNKIRVLALKLGIYNLLRSVKNLVKEKS